MHDTTAGGRGVDAARSAGRSLARVLLAIGIATASCVSPRITDRYREMRAELQRTESAPRPGPRDDLFRDTPVLERAQLVHEVLARNPSLRAAHHAWRAAIEQYPQVTSLQDPMLAYGVAPRSFGSSSVDGAYKVDLSQRFPFPGKLALRGRIALEEAEAAGHGVEGTRLRLATLTSVLFDDYYLLTRSLEINTEHVELLEIFQRLATVRYEAGMASQQDPIQAEVELSHLIHREVILHTAQRVTRGRINQLLHRPPELPLPPPPRVLLVPENRVAARERITTALQEHPDLRAAEAHVRARQAGVDLARREFRPDFTLVGSQNALWQASDLQPFVGISIHLPLRLQRRRAALEQARAQLERARADRESLEDAVRFGVQSGVDRYEEALHVVRLFRDRLLPPARDQVEAARAGFETGRNSFLALIEAERNLRTVRLGHEEAIVDLSRRQAELQRATGILPGLKR